MGLAAKIVRRGPADVLFAGEALVLLAAFRVALAMMPVRTIIDRLTRRRADQATIPDATDTSQARLTTRRVQWAVSAAARHSPVEFVCFPQALAAYTMLRRRGVPSTLVYGVARSDSGELMAHAWLTVGEVVVLGGESAIGFTAIERWT